MVLDKNAKAFIVYVTFFSLSKPMMSIYLVKKIQIALLLVKEIKIPAKY